MTPKQFNEEWDGEAIEYEDLSIKYSRNRQVALIDQLVKKLEAKKGNHRNCVVMCYRCNDDHTLDEAIALLNSYRI